jgi:hypothetical protein
LSLLKARSSLSLSFSLSLSSFLITTNTCKTCPQASPIPSTTLQQAQTRP